MVSVPPKMGNAHPRFMSPGASPKRAQTAAVIETESVPQSRLKIETTHNGSNMAHTKELET